MYAVLMVNVLEHALEIALNECHCQWGDEAKRHNVEQCWLRMFEHMHDKYGAEQGQYVGDERRVKVNFTVTIQTFKTSWLEYKKCSSNGFLIQSHTSCHISGGVQ